MRVLVAGVGHTNLRDLSVGPLLAAQLALDPTWPAGVDVRDLGYGAVQVAHDLIAWQRGAPYHRAVLFGAATRGHPPGTVTSYRWSASLPDPDVVQAHVADALTGLVSLDLLLVVGRQFGALPADIVVVEVEPEDTTWGPGCSAAVAVALETARDAIRAAVHLELQRERGDASGLARRRQL